MRKLLPCAALFCLVTPVSALAQTAPPGTSQSIDEIRKSYPAHFGGLYVNPSVLLKELGVDTNVFNESGEEKADFMFTVTPKLQLAVPFLRRALVKSTLAADGVYYQRFATERSVNPQATLRGEVYAARMTLFAEGSYLNTRQRANEELDLRVRRLLRSVGGGVAVRVTPKFAVQVAAYASATRLDDNAFVDGQRLRDTLNDDTRSYSLTASQQLTGLTRLSLMYEVQQDRFAHDPVRDTDSFRLMPGVDFKPRALVKGSARVGYRSFRPKSGLLPSSDGLVSQLALSTTVKGSTMVGVTYDRDFLFSYDATTPYFLGDHAALWVRRAVGGHFDVIGSAGRHRYDYRHVLNASPSVGRVETTKVYEANLGYRIKRQTRLGSGASYSTRESTTDSTRAYAGFRYVVTISTELTR